MDQFWLDQLHGTNKISDIIPFIKLFYMQHVIITRHEMKYPKPHVDKTQISLTPASFLYEW